MKRIVRFLFIHCIVFVSILSIIFLTQLFLDAIKIDGRDPYYNEVQREEWTTNLTEEEHYQNIVERTEKYIKIEEEINPSFNVVSHEVYLVYAFDDNPEFFLVEFTFEHKTTFEKKYSHIMGRIFNDEYYEILCECYEHEESVYTKAGVLDKKLYFHYDPWGKKETIFAYEHNGNIFRITDIYKRNHDPSEIKNIPVGWTKIIYGK